MFDHVSIVALGIAGAGLLAGLGAEYVVRCFPLLAPPRFVAFALFVILGIYGGALEMQRGHVAPVTHRALVAALIVLATIVAARLSGGMVRRHSGHAAAIGSISLFVSVSETLVAIVGGLVLLDYLGISVAPILTAFGIGGLAVALALQDTLANFFSGIQIAASRQVHAGDFVRLDENNVGTVVDINWRNTVIRDADGNRIIVPNQKLAQAIFTNYRVPLQVPVTVTLDRGADVAALAEVARQTARNVARATSDNDVAVHFDKLSDSSIDMVVTIPARDASERRRIYSDFARAYLQRVGAENGKAAKIKSVAT